MTRLWTAPGVAGVLAAVVTVWLVRALGVLLTQGVGAAVVSVPTLSLLYAAGPAVLCAVPLVILSRALLTRAGRAVPVYVVLGLVGGVLVGVVQAAVLLSVWPWQLSAGLAGELVGAPAVGGAVGGLVAGVVARRVPPPTPGPAR